MVLPDDSDITTYGGTKQNEHAVEDTTTDLDATDWNELIADAAAATRVASRAWAIVTLGATTGGMAIVAHGAVWGNGLSVKPTPSRVAAGQFDLTWPALVTDELGGSHAVAFRAAARPSLVGATLYHAQIESVAANVVRFRVWDAAAAASDAAGVNALILVL